MLLIQLKCPRCDTYSRFEESVRVEEPVLVLNGWDVEWRTVWAEIFYLRCVICQQLFPSCYDDSYAWLYWYAWWNGEEPDGRTWIDD